MRRNFSSDDEEEIGRVSLGAFTAEEARKNKRPSKSSNGEVRSSIAEIRKNSPTQSRLTLARDSVILQLSSQEKKSLQTFGKTAEETLSRNDSEKGRGSRRASDNEILEEDDTANGNTKPGMAMKDTASRLMQATDSYELIKSTLAMSFDTEQVKEHEEPNYDKKVSLRFSTTNPLLPKTITSKHSRPSTSSPRKSSIRKKHTSPSTSRTATRNVSKTQKDQAVECSQERIDSLIENIKEDPSLIHLFTPCIQ